MKISINQKNTPAANAAKATIDALFEFKGINIDEYQPNRTFLVSVDGTPTADISFDYAKWLIAGPGKSIVIKELSAAIFGETTDPRKVAPLIKEITEGILEDENVLDETPVREETVGDSDIDEPIVKESEVEPIKKPFLFPIYKS